MESSRAVRDEWTDLGWPECYGRWSSSLKKDKRAKVLGGHGVELREVLGDQTTDIIVATLAIDPYYVSHLPSRLLPPVLHSKSKIFGRDSH